MTFVLGIDSGGTKYLIRACTPDGTTLGEYVGLPAPHYRFPREEVLRRIDENIDRCLAQFGGDRADCVQIVCGTTGIDSEPDQAIVGGIYAELAGFTCPILCVNDAEIAHYAATGGVGAVVIAGTGSLAFGRNPVGETTRSGGWPICILGDEGSGTWISYMALHHLGKWFDGRVATSPLSEGTRTRLGITERHELMGVCAQIEQLSWRDPGLAAVVDEAAAAGDQYAVDLLREAAGKAFAMATSVVEKIRLDAEPEFTVGVWGSAIVNSRVYFETFSELFAARYAHARVAVAPSDAADGACRMAIRLAEGRPLYPDPSGHDSATAPRQPAGRLLD